MAKRPGSSSGIGVNYKPPGYRAVARRFDADARAGETEKKKAGTAAAPPKSAPPKPQPEAGASDQAASPPAPERDKPE
jgi:hypothetical protein